MKPKKTYTDKQKIRFVLDGFDFEKVEKIMKALKWKWHNHKTEKMYQPNAKQLRKSARSMLERSSRCGWNSGGFHAKHDGVNYTLKFVIEEKDSRWLGH